jgi:ribosomal protein S18 acetylase RimI-like enzyme
MQNTFFKLKGAAHDLIYLIHHRDKKAAVAHLDLPIKIGIYRHIEYFVYFRSLEKPLTSVEVRLPITFREATVDDLASLQVLVPPSVFNGFAKRLTNRRICTFAFYQGNIAAYSWATHEIEFEIDNVELQLGRGEVYIDDLYTFPSYRRQGIQAALQVHQLQNLREHGFKSSVAIIALDNISSQKLFKKLEYIEADRLTFQRIFFKRVYFYHNGRF